MNKIEVGQTVYLKTINSLARRNDDNVDEKLDCKPSPDARLSELGFK